MPQFLFVFRMMRICQSFVYGSKYLCNFVIGWVYELTGSADVAFYIGGSFIILAGLLIILIPVIDHFYNEEEKPTGKKPEKIQKECLNVYCM